MRAPSTAKLTEDTDTLSLALTATVTEPETLAPFAGEAIFTDGGVTSPPVLGFPPLAPEL